MSKGKATFQNSSPMEKRLLCNISLEGCGNFLLEENYNKYAMLCVSCSTDIAHKYGFTYECAGHANLSTNLPWYQQKFPGFETMEYREQIRILAFAAGSTGVLNLTDREHRGAMKIRKEMPFLYTEEKKADKTAERILEDMERDMKFQQAGDWK